MRRKAAEQEEAQRLRAAGLSVRSIAAQLGVAKSSVSVWVRGVPLPAPAPPRAAPSPTGAVAEDAVRVVQPEGAGRTCSRCRRLLPLEAFNRLGAGRQFYCRDCFRSYFRERGDRHRAQVRASAPRRRRRTRDVLLEILGAASCADCGTTDVLVLEFDHRAEKRSAVATLVRSAASRTRLLEEIALCDVVCASCHRRRTALRAGWFRATGRAGRAWSRPQLRNHQFILEVLRAARCVDCGEHDPVVLEFDHRTGKRANVSTMADWASVETLRREIAKCDVRCANCHRRRTQQALKSYRAAAVQSVAPP